MNVPYFSIFLQGIKKYSFVGGFGAMVQWILFVTHLCYEAVIKGAFAPIH